MKILDREISNNEKLSFRYQIAEFPDQTPCTVPVWVAKGAQDSPVFVVTAASHGDEYNGVVSISRFFSQLDVKKVKGVIIGLPLMNPMALMTRSRLNLLDYELQNMNRVFPGDYEGDLSQRIVKTYYDEVLTKADAVLDIHEGGHNFIARFLIIGADASNTSDPMYETEKKMAAWYGHQFPVALTSLKELTERPSYSGNLSSALRRKKIPTVTAEAGGGGRIRDEYVKNTVEAIENIAKGLGALEGEPVENKLDYIVVESEWVRPKRGGLLLHRKSSEVNNIVQKGQVLGEIIDVFGNVIEELKAPYKAVILDHRHEAVLYPGDWTYHVGQIE